MAIFDTDIDYTKLIQFTDGTLQLASFVQIRNALIKRMKDLYGNDIDVSPASADGQYVNSIALLFNNVLQSLKKGNDALDPAVATGQYLDTLCSFSNIQRRHPSASVAELYLYNSTGAPITGITRLTFIDKNNTLWTWYKGGKELTIPAPTQDEPAFLLTDVECEELGAISAPGTDRFYHYDEATGEWSEVDSPKDQSWSKDTLYSDSEMNNGTIYRCIEQNGLWVWQYKDAVVGDEEESDESLRSRRYQMLGNTSVTVLEGLKGNLLDVSAIEDVYIFNNRAPSSVPVQLVSPTYNPIADGCYLKSNSVYIAIRYKEGVDIPDESIAEIIYSKLTPGISTSPFESDSTEKLSLLKEEPADWGTEYKSYWAVQANNDPTFDVDSFWKKDGDDFILLKQEPEDWDTNYTDYYKANRLSTSATWTQNSYAQAIERKSYEIVRTDDFSDYVYWKKCSPIKPEIELYFTANKNSYDFPATLSSSTASSSTEKAIVKNLQKAISEAKINDYLSISTLLAVMQQADPQKNGMPTFFATEGDFVDTGDRLCPADLSYFKYEDSDYKFSYTTDSQGMPTGSAVLIIG